MVFLNFLSRAFGDNYFTFFSLLTLLYFAVAYILIKCIPYLTSHPRGRVLESPSLAFFDVTNGNSLPFLSWLPIELVYFCILVKRC